MLSEQRANHLLTVLALVSLFSFMGIGDQQNQWRWIALRLMGCSAALSAVYGYHKQEQSQTSLRGK